MTRKILSENLKQITTEILQNKISNINKISAMLYSVSKPEFTVTLEDLKLTISQDFIKRYTDIIVLEFTLSTQQYINIIDVYKDLKCSIIIVNHAGDKTVKQQAPITIDQKIIFKNKDDIFKTIHKSEIVVDSAINPTESQVSKRVTVQAQLIDNTLFEIRKKQFNVICRNNKIEKLLHFLVGNMIEPKKKCILKPDDDTIYPNIVIPGMMDFKDIFKYLDKKYKIYNSGTGFYYTEETMFIYPLYDFNPEISPYIVNIYFVGDNNLVGGSNFLLFKDECYHILTNRKPESTQLMEQGTENYGNGYLIQKDSLIFNKWREQEQEDFKIIPDGILRMQLDNDNTMSAYSHNLRYVYGEEQISDCMSSLASINGTVSVMVWEHAIPFIIKPGWKIMYHYDHADTYKIKSGSCLGATYKYEYVNRDGLDRLYTCTASINIFTES